MYLNNSIIGNWDIIIAFGDDVVTQHLSNRVFHTTSYAPMAKARKESATTGPLGQQS